MVYFARIAIRRVLPSFSSTRRGYCSDCPLKQLGSHLQDLKQALSPTVVLLESSFHVPTDDWEVHRSRRRGTGVFLEPNLIVTSAQAVGCVATFYEPKLVENSDRFEHGCIRHRAYIGSTAALTSDRKSLFTRPLAVNFEKDLAVLEVIKPEMIFYPYCNLSSSVPRKEDTLMAINHRENSVFEIMLGNVRAVGGKTIRARAPWPLADELGWMEHDWYMFNGGKPPHGSTLFDCVEKVTGSTTAISGSPWFNLYCEVVGIASWEVMDGPTRFSVGFAVPNLCIRSVLDYAKTKKPDDPIVMDTWIDGGVVEGAGDCRVLSRHTW